MANDYNNAKSILFWCETLSGHPGTIWYPGIQARLSSRAIGQNALVGHSGNRVYPGSRAETCIRASGQNTPCGYPGSNVLSGIRAKRYSQVYRQNTLILASHSIQAMASTRSIRLLYLPCCYIVESKIPRSGFIFVCVKRHPAAGYPIHSGGSL